MNILPFLKNEAAEDSAAIYRGKMSPRRKSHHANLKRIARKSRRQALKRGESNKAAHFGRIGFSSGWN